MILEDIGDIILGHSFREAIENTSDGNFSVLQAKNIGSGGSVQTEDLTSTFLEGTRTKALVQDQDVILSNRGTFRAGVFMGNHENVLAASSLYIIRVHDREKCLPEYLAIYLNSREGQLLLESVNRGSLIRSLPKGNLAKLRIPVPSLKIQQSVVDIHNNYQARAELYRRHSHLAEAIANQAISILISQ